MPLKSVPAIPIESVLCSSYRKIVEGEILNHKTQKIVTIKAQPT